MRESSLIQLSVSSAQKTIQAGTWAHSLLGFNRIQLVVATQFNGGPLSTIEFSHYLLFSSHQAFGQRCKISFQLDILVLLGQRAGPVLCQEVMTAAVIQLPHLTDGDLLLSRNCPIA